MEILFFWFLFGLIGTAIGTKKGYSPVVAFLAGMLLGPFALLMAFITPGSGGKKLCPQCAEWVMNAARVCKHCKHEFSEISAPPGPTECSNCKGLLMGRRDVCPHCKKAIGVA